MKKIFLILFSLICFITSYAEQTVGNYTNSYFGKDYEIEAAEKNGKLQFVYIGVEAKDSKTAFISVDGKDLELFRTALELARDKYKEWASIAKNNNVTEMTKDIPVTFPKVNIAWLGSKWWFPFGHKVNFKFIILDNNKMVASWAPKVTSSSNRYIDENIYFVFSDVDDFDNLIAQLDYQAILNELLKTKNNEELFQ